MTDVFISYRREDGLMHAHFLSEKLTNSGCRVFFDQKDIHPGNDFDRYQILFWDGRFKSSIEDQTRF